jgi:imidazolonepropionase-like amidohydrolase
LKYSTLLLLLLLSCAGLSEKKGAVAIHCGHLFDSEKGIWLKRQTLLIQDGVIVAVNPPRLPGEVKEIDYSQEYIIPGLIDAHTHVFLEDPTFTADFAMGLQKFMETHSDESRKLIGENRLRSLLHSGFTSVRDLGNQGGLELSSVKQDGARLFSSGPGFSPRDGQLPAGAPAQLLRKEYRSLSDEVPQNFRFDLVKVYADEDPNPHVARIEDIRKWVNWAHQHNLKVAGHAILKPGIDVAINAGVDSLEHGSFATQSHLQKMKEKGIIFVPTNADSLFLLPSLNFLAKPHTRDVTNRNCKNIHMARKTGVALAFGSDNYFSTEKWGVSFGSGTLEILLGYKNCGLAPLEILQAATFVAAKTMGKEKIVGSLSEGAFADLVVLPGNPSEDIELLRKPVAVYLNGIRQP